MDKRLKMQPTEVSVKDMIMEKMELENKVFDLESQLAALRERAGRLEEMASKLVEAGKCQYRDNRFGNLVEQAISISQALSTPAPAGEADQ